MKPLEPPDSHHLSAAQGWIELGNPQEAEDDLARIAPGLHAHPDVLEVRWHIQAHLKNWEKCFVTADAVLRLDTERSSAWIHRSFALHELKRTREALELLAPAADKFPAVWTIPYNLACYCTQLGMLGEARDWLKRALAIDERVVKRAACEDPDLKPLRDSVTGSF